MFQFSLVCSVMLPIYNCVLIAFKYFIYIFLLDATIFIILCFIFLLLFLKVIWNYLFYFLCICITEIHKEIFFVIFNHFVFFMFSWIKALLRTFRTILIINLYHVLIFTSVMNVCTFCVIMYIHYTLMC